VGEKQLSGAKTAENKQVFENPEEN